ncbi:DUF4124 domain-containing protein [Neptunomonas sp.]|uniref:DUF4124 domain-containing protein n=1 Tax=Neptunomonas sp. TaxID=1971898 RepID=UPI0035672D21
MIRLRSLLITVTLLTLSSAASADYVYKCQSAEGRKVFSGFPCGPNAVKEEYRNLAPARKVKENLPPRQGALLNKTRGDNKMNAPDETQSRQKN